MNPNLKLAIRWILLLTFLTCVSISIPPAISLIESGVYHFKGIVTDTMFAWTAALGLVITLADWRYKFFIVRPGSYWDTNRGNA